MKVANTKPTEKQQRMFDDLDEQLHSIIAGSHDAYISPALAGLTGIVFAYMIRLEERIEELEAIAVRSGQHISPVFQNKHIDKDS